MIFATFSLDRSRNLESVKRAHLDKTPEVYPANWFYSGWWFWVKSRTHTYSRRTLWVGHSPVSGSLGRSVSLRWSTASGWSASGGMQPPEPQPCRPATVRATNTTTTIRATWMTGNCARCSYPWSCSVVCSSVGASADLGMRPGPVCPVTDHLPVGANKQTDNAHSHHHVTALALNRRT